METVDTHEMLNRILSLMDERSIRPAQITKELNLSGSSFTDWKKGKGTPSVQTVARIAQRFNVSIDYLVFGKIKQDGAMDFSNREAISLVFKFNQLKPELKEKVLVFIEGMIAASETNKKTDNPKNA